MDMDKCNPAVEKDENAQLIATPLNAIGGLSFPPGCAFCIPVIIGPAAIRRIFGLERARTIRRTWWRRADQQRETEMDRELIPNGLHEAIPIHLGFILNGSRAHGTEAQG
jgi:hypothetical protein